MIPHKHWLRNYQPLTISICLANNTVIFSEGVGSVVFAPEVEGELVRHVEFSRVLCVPELGSNLLSALYLAQNHRFNVHISSKHMDFVQGGVICFCAPINASNTAQLAGTVIPSPEFALAGSASTLPLDESLWHHHFAHFHHAGLRELMTEGVVLGLKLDFSTPTDSICEPCLSGKLNTAPFPPSSSRADRPLALVHSDIHGPLPVRMHPSYHYWSTWIDDHGCFKVVIPLKAKFEAFDAFKRFKTYAETQLGIKIAALQDDKGGEYMSKEFEDFCIEHGIARCHTVRNWPQQNNVAERFNCTLAERITAVLYEAGLPMQF
jgi:hypothetical protein